MGYFENIDYIGQDDLKSLYKNKELGLYTAKGRLHNQYQGG